MSEKRKPTRKIVAEKGGKRMRIELFPATLWPEKFHREKRTRYRIRVNGKWAQGDHAFTITEVMRQLRMWLK